MLMCFGLLTTWQSKLIYQLVGCLPVQPNNMHGPKGAVCQARLYPGASSLSVLIGDPAPTIRVESLRGKHGASEVGCS